MRIDELNKKINLENIDLAEVASVLFQYYLVIKKNKARIEGIYDSVGDKQIAKKYKESFKTTLKFMEKDISVLLSSLGNTNVGIKNYLIEHILKDENNEVLRYLTTEEKRKSDKKRRS